MKLPLKISTYLIYALLTACVTINVYFPAAAAEKAADRIIQDIYGKQPAENPVTPPSDDKSSSSNDKSKLFTTLLNSLIPQAWAAEPNINISSPGINKLQASMKNRHSALAPFYASGGIGMTNTGLLTIKDISAIELSGRNQAKQLVAAENRDRNALYPEIAAANGHPEWEPQIRQIFGKRWIANAPSGWWYQNASGAWQQK